MNTERMITELESVAEKYRNKITFTGEVNITAMCEDVLPKLRKLKEYEDLEEQGLLLKLPCQLGTKVYYIQRCFAPSCKECLGFTKVNNCYCKFKSRIFEQEFGSRHLKAFGKTVFLTQVEAEEKLKKIESEG